MTPTQSHAVSQGAFEARYRRSRDPWNFAGSPYEQGRYQTTLSALSRTAYDTAYEPGCSVGVLTERLARVCRHVIAADFAPSAVAKARIRCSHLPNVDIRCASVERFVPAEPLDLVVFSELGYYFEPAQLARIAGVLAERLTYDGEFLAVHWLGHSTDHVVHGDSVHETLHKALPLTWLKGERYPDFRIDCWRRS